MNFKNFFPLYYEDYLVKSLSEIHATSIFDRHPGLFAYFVLGLSVASFLLILYFEIARKDDGRISVVARILPAFVIIFGAIYFIVESSAGKREYYRLSSEHKSLQEAFPKKSYLAGKCAVGNNKTEVHNIALADGTVVTVYTPLTYVSELSLTTSKIMEVSDGKYKTFDEMEKDFEEKYPWLFTTDSPYDIAPC